ncbi:unnamed protein product [Linum trigynum]|uniref:Netrin receptor DCC n=1 Tax=Linum trigynum TaxID=586398 RepID=A0AAV2CWG3_9ROSI
MPTFSAIALDRLLEPGASKSVDKSTPPSGYLVAKPKPPPPRSTLHRRNSTSITERSPHRPQLTPSLYTTPEATPVPPSSPTSYTSSPYIINHKRRGPRLSKSASVDNIASQRKALDKDEAEGSSKSAESQVDDVAREKPAALARLDFDKAEPKTVIPEISKEKELPNGIRNMSPKALQINGHHEGAKARSNGKVGITNLRHGILKENDSSGARDSDIEDFFDPQESMSHASNTDSEDNIGSSAMQSSSVQMAEFFDAWEELSSESGIQSALHDFQSELRGTRLSLLMEIEKRRQAEDALKTVESQWQRIRQQLALAGLTVPRCPIDVAESDEPNSTTDPAEELCQQLDVVRFVSSSIGRGIARAEMEVEMEAQLEAKNFEIARLVDRLRYYEAVNREMSQRNQEAVEMARRNRQVQKRRQRWVWGSIAAAITLGTAALAWSYLPPRDGSAASTSSSSVESEQPDSATSD